MLNYFRKNFHRRCLRRSQIRLWDTSSFPLCLLIRNVCFFYGNFLIYSIFKNKTLHLYNGTISWYICFDKSIWLKVLWLFKKALLISGKSIRASLTYSTSAQHMILSHLFSGNKLPIFHKIFHIFLDMIVMCLTLMRRFWYWNIIITKETSVTWLFL